MYTKKIQVSPGIFHGIPLESGRRCSTCRNGQITKGVRKIRFEFPRGYRTFFRWIGRISEDSTFSVFTYSLIYYKELWRENVQVWHLKLRRLTSRGNMFCTSAFTGTVDCSLPVNALAQNMFSGDVKRLSFRCQTFKFSRPTVKFYFSTLLKGKMIVINKKGRKKINYQKRVSLSTICAIKWKNLRRIILPQKLGED